MHDNSNSVRVEVTISNRQGLHARPVMRFVDIAMKYDCEIRVHKNELTVDGKSPMEMMLLEAVQGTVLALEAIGDGATEALEELARLIDGKFGED
ncbi:MAG: HPr family phosphocarrier protein [Phycisphaerales bacterium]|nr:HPr family phosphocarrier protein [Phycisphaerales bacterium]